MDAVMMGRVQGLGGQHFADQGLRRQPAADRRTAIVVVPKLPEHEGFGFELVGIAVMKFFPAPEQFAPPLAIDLLVAMEVGFERVDPIAFARAGLLLTLDGFGQKRFGPDFVVKVGHRHAPVGHRTIGIERRHLAKRPLCLVIPEAVQLPDPLVEELLGGRHFGRDRDRHLAGAPHQIRGLARPFVEDFAVRGVPGQHGCRGRRAGGGRGRRVVSQQGRHLDQTGHCQEQPGIGQSQRRSEDDRRHEGGFRGRAWRGSDCQNVS